MTVIRHLGERIKARDLDTVLHTVCDHHGWNGEISVERGIDGNCWMQLTVQDDHDPQIDINLKPMQVINAKGEPQK